MFMDWKTYIDKMSKLPKVIYKFNAIPIKIPVAFFYRNRKSNFKIHMEPQRPRVAKVILSKKNKAGSITLPEFKIYHNATTMKTLWYWIPIDSEMCQNKCNYCLDTL